MGSSGDFDSCRLSPSPMIDSMWHLHILDTKCYSDFCEAIFPPIGPFIHHDIHGKYSSEIEKNKRIKNTKAAYEKVYKEECNFFDGESQYYTSNQKDPKNMAETASSVETENIMLRVVHPYSNEKYFRIRMTTSL